MNNEAANPFIGAIRHFNRYYTNLLGLLNRNRLDSPYSLAEARVVLEIGKRENCTASYLKDLLKIDFGYLSRIIRQLLRDGIVSEERSPRDGRSRLLQLTATGQEALTAIDTMSDRQIADMVRPLSSGELAELVGHMKAIEAILTRKA